METTWYHLETTWTTLGQRRILGFPNWDSFETPFGTILRHFSGQLWDTFWDNFGTALINLLASVETKLRQLWDNFGTTFRQLWNNFLTALGQLWNNFGMILGQLWDKIRTAFRQLLDNLGTTFRQLWKNFTTAFGRLQDNFKMVLGQLWDNFGTTLGPHGDYVVTIGSANIFPVDRIWPLFTKHLHFASSVFWISDS